ncbi:MAG: hypothetical protein MZU84_06850 [Sphingobacterium sp.]|nr:hypothetical protein [Sphingobacterium sp.]
MSATTGSRRAARSCRVQPTQHTDEGGKDQCADCQPGRHDRHLPDPDHALGFQIDVSNPVHQAAQQSSQDDSAIPPMTPNSTASAVNMRRTSPLVAPSALSTPISRVRS